MPSASDDEVSATRGFAFTAGVLVVLFAAAVITQVLGSSWGKSSRANASTLVWPVIWHFYTNSAHQDFVVVYRIDEEAGTFHLLTRPIADAEHRWGLGHSAYADVARLGATVRAIPPSAWRPCAATEMKLCSEVIAAVPGGTIVSRWESVSGPVVFAIERPAGWHDGRSRRIERVAVVDLVYPE